MVAVSARVLRRGARFASSSAAGLVIDALIGDEPLRPHPVAVFGALMQRVERVVWRDRRAAGVAFAAAGLSVAAGGGALLGRVPGGPALAAYTTVAARGLWGAAAAVSDALAVADIGTARRLVPALVGRDAAELDEPGLARAAIESVAENTVDGIVAPLLFAAIGGPSAALGYRALNTLDSMVGYRDARHGRFGWASARLDDAANYVPSRVTAALVAIVRPAAAREIWRAVREDAPGHPSPNAGVAEAAFAAALGVRLGGANHYRGQEERRIELGSASARVPSQGDIALAVKCSKDVTFALLVALLAVSAAARARSALTP
jgi:adenosylcobinamide-phosphate synthase